MSMRIFLLFLLLTMPVCAESRLRVLQSVAERMGKTLYYNGVLGWTHVRAEDGSPEVVLQRVLRKTRLQATIRGEKLIVAAVGPNHKETELLLFLTCTAKGSKEVRVSPTRME